MCPICDGFEVRGQRVGVLGDGPHGVAEAMFIQTFSDQVTLIHVGRPEALDAEARAGQPASGQVFAFAGIARGLQEPQVIP